MQRGRRCFVLLVVWWLVAGRPVDWPWNWNHYLFGRIKVNKFLSAVEANDLAKAYGIWIHDKNWQQHPAQHGVYPFDASRTTGALPARTTNTEPSRATRSCSRAATGMACWWPSSSTAARAMRSIWSTTRIAAN